MGMYMYLYIYIYMYVYRSMLEMRPQELDRTRRSSGCMALVLVCLAKDGKSTLMVHTLRLCNDIDLWCGLTVLLSPPAVARPQVTTEPSSLTAAKAKGLA